MQQGQFGFDRMQCLGKLASGGAHQNVGDVVTHMNGRASQAAVVRRTGIQQSQAVNDWQAIQFSIMQSSRVVAMGPAAVGDLPSAVLVGRLPCLRGPVSSTLGVMSKLLLLLCIFASSALASPAFVGTWFSCENQSGEYSILTVKEANNHYTGFLESSNNGGVYTASLSGNIRKSSLSLNGCQNYRGEICPEPKRQINITLKNNSRGSGFTHIKEQSLDKRIKQCSKNSQSEATQ